MHLSSLLLTVAMATVLVRGNAILASERTIGDKMISPGVVRCFGAVRSPRDVGDDKRFVRSLESVDAKRGVGEERGIHFNLDFMSKFLKVSPAKKAATKKAADTAAKIAEATVKKVKAFEYSGLEDRLKGSRGGTSEELAMASKQVAAVGPQPTPNNTERSLHL
ncbi:unnamed protein product [Phytophthora lilii]|uniref:RxLR effector protein n=1 Tax=Phytophthora lilii TaxID=2077276 RepID=A0A9W6TCD5_9STRA|nr:unnamed protein product [Phytophthora lilii]